MSAEILCLGNELLIGRTVNKNATDIALQLTKLGIRVTRVTTTGDWLDQGIKVLKEIINRHPHIVCITGGLGPTHDDIQLDIVAGALGSELQENQQALDMISAKYRKMNTSRRKMALLPVGSIPLPNSQGSAPGVITKIDHIRIFSLPGVPREMKAILQEEIIPYLKEEYDVTTPLVEFGVDIHGARESDIAKLIDKVRKQYPDINFKSHPRFDGEEYWLSLHTYAHIEDETKVREALKHWIRTIEEVYSIEKSEITPIFTPDFEPEEL